jgi:hypothetical protein
MKDKNTQKIVIGVALGFLFGFGAAWIWLDKNESAVADVFIENKISEAGEVVTEINGSELSFLVKDQEAGSSVLVENINTEGNFWFVVYEEKDALPGWILGARLYESERAVDPLTLEIPLLRETVTGMKYFVILHHESGDRIFDYKEDIVARNDDDSVVQAEFIAE